MDSTNERGNWTTLNAWFWEWIQKNSFESIIRSDEKSCVLILWILCPHVLAIIYDWLIYISIRASFIHFRSLDVLMVCGCLAQGHVDIALIFLGNVLKELKGVLTIVNCFSSGKTSLYMSMTQMMCY